VVLASLLVAAPAAAHVSATPPYLATGGSETIDLSVPNERDAPMTNFSVTVPSGFEIVHAHVAEGWNATSEGSTATWRGGSLAPGVEAMFGLELRAQTEPGAVQFQAEQGYDDGAVVRWPVSLTVIPADESSSQSLALVGVVGLLGVLVVAAAAILAWRRRSAPLQEK
jgi:uncharacterized protein YcnI